MPRGSRCARFRFPKAWRFSGGTFSDRREAEEKLRESEQRYRSLFNNVIQGLAISQLVRDEQGRVVDACYLDLNPAYEAQTGSARAEAIGRLASEIFPLIGPFWLEMAERVVETGQPERTERFVADVDRWFSFDMAPFEQTDQFVVFYDNITNRKRAETVLRDQEERQAFLLQVGDEMRAAATDEAKIEVATRMVGVRLNASRVLWAEYDWEANLAHIFNGWFADGARPFPRVMQLAEYDGEVLNQLKAGRTVRVDNVGLLTDEPAYAAIADAGVQALLSPPLVVGGKLKVNLSIHQHEPRTWTDDEVALVEEVADRLWAEVERARAEAALRESEGRFRAIAEQAVDYAIFTTDADGRIDSWQPGAAAVFGWSAEEAIGRDAAMLWTPEDRASGEDEKEFREAQETGMAPDVRWHLRKDGSRVFIDGVARSRQSRGEPRGLLKIGRDMSDRHRAEEALRESDERFRQFGEASTDIVWIRNVATLELEYVSPAFEPIYGRTRAEIGREVDRWTSLLHPDDRERVMADFDRVRSGESVTHEFRVIRPDGQVRWLDDLDFPLRDEAGRITRIGGISHDITAVKRAADALRESEERFRSFADATEEVLWIVDAATLQLEYVSPAYERIWGEPREPIMADLGEWAARIHPDDLPGPGEGLEALLAGRSFTADYRVRRRDGTTRFVRDTGFPIFDEKGRVRRLAGVAQDLTDRRVAERALAEGERRLRTLMEGIPQLVWRSSDKGWWTWSSPQWQDCTGQTQEQSHGLGWLEALHPDDRAAAIRAWELALPHGMLDVEYRVRRASDGAYLWHHTRSVPVRDEAGGVIEWLGTTTDVQVLKELQERQAVLVAELQHRTRNLMGVVRSLSDKTARLSADLPDFRVRFRDRLDALARVQGLLSRLNDVDRVTFDDLIRTELEAMDGSADRVILEGPSGIRLRSSTVQTLAMALHELATNAVKYGALKQPQGQLAIRWSLDRSSEDGKPWLHVDWRESGVEMPSASSAHGSGQGRELIERALPYQLGATTTYTLGRDGVHCTITIPVSATAEANGRG